MARDFDKNVSNYMSLGTGTTGAILNGAAAISVSARVIADTLDTGDFDNRILNLIVNGGGAGVYLGVKGDVSPKVLKVGGRSVTGDAFQERNGTVEITTATLHTLGGVLNFTGDTITPYVDGVADNGGAATFGNNTYTYGTATSPDNIGGSGAPPSGTSIQWDGPVAEIGIWTSALSAADFAALHKGVSPLLIQPQSLAIYIPMIGKYSPEIDIVGGLSGTITGTIATLSHPLVIRAF